MKTLLQKAKEAKTKISYKKRSNPEMTELAVAWLNGEITTGQATKAIKGDSHTNNTSVLFQLCVAIREGINNKEIYIRVINK